MSAPQPASVNSRTALACVIAIVAVVPAWFVAWAVVGIYSLIAGLTQSYVGAGNATSWIPFFDDFFGIWLPVFLRGCVAGLGAIYVTALLFKNANHDIVRAVMLAFWAAIGLWTMVYNYMLFGAVWEQWSVMLLLVGLAVGAWGARGFVQPTQRTLPLALKGHLD